MDLVGSDRFALHRTGLTEEIDESEMWITEGRPFTSLQVGEMKIKPTSEAVEVNTGDINSGTLFSSNGIKFTFPLSSFELKSEEEKIEIKDEETTCEISPSLFSLSDGEKQTQFGETNFLIDSAPNKCEVQNNSLSFSDSVNPSFSLTPSGFGTEEKFFRFPHPDTNPNFFTLNSGNEVQGLFYKDGILADTRGTNFYAYQHQFFPIYLCETFSLPSHETQIFRPTIIFGDGDGTKKIIKFKINSERDIVKLRIKYKFPTSEGFVIPTSSTESTEWSTSRTFFSSQLIRGSVENEDGEDILVLKKYKATPVFDGDFFNYELSYPTSNPHITGTLVIDFVKKIIKFFLKE